MAQNSTQITGIAISELKTESRHSRGEGVEVGTLKHLPRTYFSLTITLIYTIYQYGSKFYSNNRNCNFRTKCRPIPKSFIFLT